ncbi:hypothetical protein KIPB_015715, partial [Kipferlia bialata]|eukprot:g15715.t1
MVDVDFGTRVEFVHRVFAPLESQVTTADPEGYNMSANRSYDDIREDGCVYPPTIKTIHSHPPSCGDDVVCMNGRLYCINYAYSRDFPPHTVHILDMDSGIWTSVYPEHRPLVDPKAWTAFWEQVEMSEPPEEEDRFTFREVWKPFSDKILRITESGETWFFHP